MSREVKIYPRLEISRTDLYRYSPADVEAEIRELQELLRELEQRNYVMKRYHYARVTWDTESRCESCNRILDSLNPEARCANCGVFLCDHCHYPSEDDTKKLCGACWGQEERVN